MMSRRKGVILSYFYMIFEIISTLFLTPFIIRSLGQAEYGVFKLVCVINTYLLLLDLGVGNSIIRFIAKYRVEKNKEKERQFLGVATIFYLVVAIIALCVGIIMAFNFPSLFAKGLSPEEARLGQKLLIIAIVESSVVLGTAAYNNILIAYEKYEISRGASIIQIIARIILTFIVLLLGLGSIGILSVNLLMTFICRSFYVFYVRKIIQLKPKFKGINFSFLKEIITYSSLILLQMIATQINASVDQILIGSLVESSAIILAIYGIGTQISQYFQTVGSASTGVLMPGVVAFVEQDPDSNALTAEMVRISRLIFIILSFVWCGFLVYGKEFVVLWAGKEYETSYYIALILMSAQLFILSESVGTQILWAMNKHMEQSFLKLFIVLLNIVLTVYLIKWNPLFGATIGTFISLMLGDVCVMNLIFKRKLNIRIFCYYKQLLKGILPCMIITILINFGISYFMPKSWGYFVLKIIILVITFSCLLLSFGMTQYEKQLSFSIISKIFHRRKSEK